MKGVAEFEIIGRVAVMKTVGIALKVDIAADYPRKNADGSWNENTHWNTVTVFDEKMAQRIEQGCEPGDIVRAVGRVRNTSYEDRDGNKVYTVQLACLSFNLVARKKNREDAADTTGYVDDRSAIEDDIPI